MQRLSGFILYLSVVVVALSGAALTYMLVFDAPAKKIEATDPAPKAARPVRPDQPPQQSVPAPASTSASAPARPAPEAEREYRPVWIAPTTKYKESALPPLTGDKAGETPPADIVASEPATGDANPQEPDPEAVERLRERPHNLQAELPAPPPPPPASALPRVDFESPFHRDTNQ